MSQYTVPILQLPGNYNKCIVAHFLSKLFQCASSAEPQIAVCNSITEAKTYLQRIHANIPTELTVDYLQTIESATPDIPHYYAFAFDNNRPVFFCYFQLLPISSANFKADQNKSISKKILHFVLDVHKVKVLYAGNLLRNETRCIWFDNSTMDSPTATELMEGFARRIANDQNAAAIVLRDFDLTESSLAFLNKAGYTVPWKDQVMEMEVPVEWNNIEDYTACLSRKYKARAKKILACRKTLELRQLNFEETLRYKDECYKLYCNVADGQPFLPARVGKDYIPDLKKCYGDAFEVFGYFKENKLVAFFTGMIGGSDYELYLIGLDYTCNEELNLYFNILFAGLEQAIKYRKSKLKLGRTCFDAKASLGAKPVELPYLIKADGIYQAAMTWFAKYFSSLEDGQWRLRHPMK